MQSLFHRDGQLTQAQCTPIRSQAVAFTHTFEQVGSVVKHPPFQLGTAFLQFLFISMRFRSTRAPTKGLTLAYALINFRSDWLPMGTPVL